MLINISNILFSLFTVAKVVHTYINENTYKMYMYVKIYSIRVYIKSFGQLTLNQKDKSKICKHVV